MGTGLRPYRRSECVLCVCVCVGVKGMHSFMEKTMEKPNTQKHNYLI